MNRWRIYVRTTVDESLGTDADDVADTMLIALVNALPLQPFTVGLERADES